MSLVEVPCWWDGQKDSLLSSISFIRPDLLPLSSSPSSSSPPSSPSSPSSSSSSSTSSTSSPSSPSFFSSYPIPLNAPPGFFSYKDVPDVGELMLPSFPIEPPDVSLRKWWLGEKYDGIRCCWNPIQRQLYTRTGNQLSILESLKPDVPIFIDAEIWAGRGCYNSIQPISVESLSIDWHYLRLVTFDVPSIGNNKPLYEDRYELLLGYINSLSPFFILAPRQLCNKNHHLQKTLKNIINESGEGIILQASGSIYENGRTSSVIKLKTTFSDEEAIVLGQGPDRSLSLKLVDGRIIKVLASQVHVSTPPTGSVVTLSFSSRDRPHLPSSPSSPSVSRLRHDLLWDDCLLNFAKDNKHPSEYSRVPGSVGKPVGYWTAQNMRALLERYALSRNLDPSLSESWNKITYKDINEIEGGDYILRKFKGYHNMLATLFPEITFTNTSYGNIEHRRRFFENYAHTYNFDPLLATNWYSQPMVLLLSFKEVAGIMYYHNNSLSQTLVDLFPNIGINISKLWSNNVWQDSQTRRRFFERYAQEKGFDPLVAENWYKQTKLSIMTYPGIYNVILHHNNDYAQALIDFFPQIGLVKSSIGRLSWRTNNLRRDFFESYAKANLFDPLIPENWYQQTRSNITSYKSAFSVLSHYNNNVGIALLDVFPNIGLEKSKFAWRRMTP